MACNLPNICSNDSPFSNNFPSHSLAIGASVVVAVVVVVVVVESPLLLLPFESEGAVLDKSLSS